MARPACGPLLSGYPYTTAVFQELHMQFSKSKRASETTQFPVKALPQEFSQETSGTSTPCTDERLLTPREVAARLGVSQRWVRDHATRRIPRIPAVRLGPLLRFRWSDIADFLSRQMSQGPSKNERSSV